MKNIFKSISYYTPFARSSIQRDMAYKTNFFMRIFGGLIQVLILYYLWMAIFDSSGSTTIQGFNKDEMVIYIIMCFITSRIVNNSPEWAVSDDIISGNIATNLIKPISYEKRILSESIGYLLSDFLSISLPVWVCFYVYKYFTSDTTPPSILNILLFIVSIVLAFLINYIFNFIFAISAFFVTYIWGFMLCKNIIVNFFSGGLIPIAFFPEVIRDILVYLPFKYIVYTPVMIYMEKLSNAEIIQAIGIQFIWVIILYGIYKLLWSKAIKRVYLVYLAV